MTGLLILALAAQVGPEITIKHGDLEVLFRDNSQSPRILSGVQALFNTKSAPGYDAFDPSSGGAGAGLNYEHVISGHANRANKFTPRHGRSDLVRVNESTLRLVRKKEDSPWAVSSTLTYTVKAPHYVDFEFRCTPHDASKFGARKYAIFFFANYMNDVAKIPLQFRGVEREGAEESWISGGAPPGHADWNQGGTYRHLKAAPLAMDKDVRFRLNTWSYDWPRFTKPFYYGQAGKGMTLILMFDRTSTPTDEVRFSIFKFKVRKWPRPAWDFQYVIRKAESGKEYGFKGRLVWKKFVSPDDCLKEYTKWSGELR